MGKLLLPIGLVFVALEHLLNYVAYHSNGGSMPVNIHNNTIIITPNRITMNTTTTHFKLLCDIIRISNRIYSIGDLIGIIGFMLFCAGIIYWSIYLTKKIYTFYTFLYY